MYVYLVPFLKKKKEISTQVANVIFLIKYSGHLSSRLILTLYWFFFFQVKDLSISFCFLLGSFVFTGRPFYFFFVSFSILLFFVSLNFQCRRFFRDCSFNLFLIFTDDASYSEFYTAETIFENSLPVESYRFLKVNFV